MKLLNTSALVYVCTASLATLFAASSAQGGMVLSEVIVDFQPGKPTHEDIEVWNDGPDRIYVVVDPAEIDNPGTTQERRVSNPDPAVSGLLATPQRLVLEPDQRRVIRISAVSPRRAVDRIYRVTVKPVAGPISADASALKVLVGYDVLVLYRPQVPSGDVTASRIGRTLTIRNQSNTARELFGGKQCDTGGQNCKDLPAKRVYAGATWEQTLPYDRPVEYQITSGNGAVRKQF